VVCCRVMPDDYELTCMRAIMLHGSMNDKLVYKSAMVVHRALCDPKDKGINNTHIQSHSLVKLRRHV